MKKKKADEYVAVVEEQFDRARASIENKIDRFIRRYAVNDKITMVEATKYLSEAEFKDFKMSLDEYIRLGQENAVHYSADIARDLERASLEYRITRLAALETELKAEIASIYGIAENVTCEGLGEMYEELYGRTAFEIFKGIGYMDISFAIPDMALIDSVIRSPWSKDGLTFSMHLWIDQTTFISDLTDLLSQQFMLGSGYQKATRELQQIYGRPLSECKRVIYTESAFFQGKAQTDCYRQLGVERYQFLSELNTKVCSICGKLDSKVFRLDERRPGVNAIPMHPNCRCVEAPYINQDNQPGFRSGRNEYGKSVEFPENMTYEEWYEQVGRTLEENTIS